MKLFWLLPILSLVGCVNDNAFVRDIDGTNKSSIVNGVDVKESEAYADSTVALVTRSWGGDVQSFCTGTLISKDLVVTAAHCLIPLGHINAKVLFGVKMPDSFDDAHLVDIADTLKHKDFAKNYETGIAVNDVGLIKLAAPVPEGFKPAPILGNGFKIKPGQLITLVGWGRLSEERDLVTKTLQKTVVPVAALRDMEIVVDQSAGNGACNGDSGGPSYIETAKGLVLLGLTRGPEEGFTDCHHRAVYTLLVNYRDFLQYAAETMHCEYPQFVSP